MTEKHTPGPWTYKLQEPSDNYLGKKPFWYVISRADGRTLCKIWHLQEPDARLIAAAPDMLRVCEAIVKYFDSRMGVDYTYEEGEEYALHVMAQNAIAKARVK